MRAKAKPRRKRIRKRKAMKRRAILAPYIRELEHSRVPQSSVKAATTMMNILLGGRGNQ
jgi:hypothetical protein